MKEKIIHHKGRYTKIIKQASSRRLEERKGKFILTFKSNPEFIKMSYLTVHYN